MAYITQVEKKVIGDALKVALKGYPTLKYSLSIQNRSHITCKITKGPKFLDPESKGSFSVNHYYIDENYKDNKEAAKVLNLIKDCLHIGHFDHSDTQSDYFDCAWYISIEIGAWAKRYEVV